jgi:(p)ppGpp synthase/HD superfamily hydrolase
MVMTSRFDDAFCYAHELHREQHRKGSKISYVSHLMAVSALVIEHGGNEDQAIGALLHDAVEDAGCKKILEHVDDSRRIILKRTDADHEEPLRQIRERFGNVVAEIVADCTDAWTIPKPAWRPRKEAYLNKLRAKQQELRRSSCP